ncbi:23679_t:CDS:2 [Gigaspora rosea]|nr:23679_t:CDS:2 [Gigaspora rosea]
MPEVTTSEEQTSNTQPITVEPAAINKMSPTLVSQTNETNKTSSEQNIPQNVRKLRGGGVDHTLL